MGREPYLPQARTLLRRYVLHALPWWFLFIVLPALTGVTALVTGVPETFGRPFAVILLIVAAVAAVSTLADVRRKFGLRLVPQFERPPRQPPQTYFKGARIMSALKALDERAERAGMKRLSGYVREDAWFDSGEALGVLRALRSDGDDAELARDLESWERALEAGATEQLRFRLVIVTGTAMNGMLWGELQNAGF